MTPKSLNINSSRTPHPFSTKFAHRHPPPILYLHAKNFSQPTLPSSRVGGNISQTRKIFRKKVKFFFKIVYLKNEAFPKLLVCTFAALELWHISPMGIKIPKWEIFFLGPISPKIGVQVVLVDLSKPCKFQLPSTLGFREMGKM